jgi:hypothetical protein
VYENKMNEMNKMINDLTDKMTRHLEQIKENIQWIYVNNEKQGNELKFEISRNRLRNNGVYGKIENAQETSNKMMKQVGTI